MEKLDYFSINQPYALLLSFSLFMVFKELTIPYSKTINLLGASTFGVYLFHDNNLLRSYMWLDIFHIAESKYLIPYSLLLMIVVFAIGFLLNRIYQKTLAKTGDRLFLLLQKAGSAITEKCSS